MSKSDENANKPQQPKRTPVTRHNYQSLIEQRFQQAQEDGLFDNLPGAGKPLNLDDDALVPAEDRAGYRLLKANGFALPWIEARREIAEGRADLDTWLEQANRRWPHLNAASRAALRVAYRRKLEDLQRLILTFNLKTPRGVEQLETLRLAEELQRLGAPPS
jgi:DnaJ homolog subfamily C member 28